MAISGHDPTAPRSRQPDYTLSSTLRAHSRAVTALQFSPDGTFLVSAGADGWLHFWHPTTGAHLRGICAHKTGINDISISPDSLYIATAADDNTSAVHLLHPTPRLTFHPPAVTAPPTSDSDDPPEPAQPARPLVTPATEHSATHPPAIRHLATHTAPVLSVAFSPKSNLLATASFDESAIIWDVKRGRALRQIPAHADAVWCVAWDQEGEMILTGSADGLIRLWDANTGQCLKTLDNDTNSPISYASFTPSTFFLLSSTLSSTLRIYNIHSGKVIKTISAPGQFVNDKYPSPALIYHALPPLPGDTRPQPVPRDVDPKHMPDGRKRLAKSMRDAWIVSGSENGTVVIWDIQTKQVIQSMDAHTGPVVALAVSADGRTIATGSMDNEKAIKLWTDAR